LEHAGGMARLPRMNSSEAELLGKHSIPSRPWERAKQTRTARDLENVGGMACLP